ncbi:MAG TPA: hypothetical protein VIG32_10550 [Candidatus Baltobacteraceae bacterium]
MFEPLTIHLGANTDGPHLVIEVIDYQHPEIAEPEGLDLMRCRATAHAHPVSASFDIPIGLWELEELRDYLSEINSGNGPSTNVSLGSGLLALSFAPTKRGPVLCAVLLKTVDASHVRLEFLVTLEPAAITRTLMQLARLTVRTSKINGGE